MVDITRTITSMKIKELGQIVFHFDYQGIISNYKEIRPIKNYHLLDSEFLFSICKNMKS